MSSFMMFFLEHHSCTLLKCYVFPFVFSGWEYCNFLLLLPSIEWIDQNVCVQSAKIPGCASDVGRIFATALYVAFYSKIFKMADALQASCAAPVFKRPRLEFSPCESDTLISFESLSSEERFSVDSGLQEDAYGKLIRCSFALPSVPFWRDIHLVHSCFESRLVYGCLLSLFPIEIHGLYGLWRKSLALFEGLLIFLHTRGR